MNLTKAFITFLQDDERYQEWEDAGSIHKKGSTFISNPRAGQYQTFLNEEPDLAAELYTGFLEEHNITLNEEDYWTLRYAVELI